MNEPVSLWCDLEPSGYMDGMILAADQEIPEPTAFTLEQ